ADRRNPAFDRQQSRLSQKLHRRAQSAQQSENPPRRQPAHASVNQRHGPEAPHYQQKHPRNAAHHRAKTPSPAPGIQEVASFRNSDTFQRPKEETGSSVGDEPASGVVGGSLSRLISFHCASRKTPSAWRDHKSRAVA